MSGGRLRARLNCDRDVCGFAAVVLDHVASMIRTKARTEVDDRAHAAYEKAAAMIEHFAEGVRDE